MPPHATLAFTKPSPASIAMQKTVTRPGANPIMGIESPGEARRIIRVGPGIPARRVTGRPASTRGLPRCAVDAGRGHAAACVTPEPR